MKNSNKVIKWSVVSGSKKFSHHTRDLARAQKRDIKSSGKNAYIEREEYTLVNKNIIR